MRDNSLLTIPYFITAKTPQELQKKMRTLQFKLKHKLTFFDIGPYKSGLIAWYEFRKDPLKVEKDGE
jgi:hypothetical protein